MSSISVRLWIPSDIPLQIASEAINDVLSIRNLTIPFNEPLQNILNSMFLRQSSGRLVAHLFRIMFPRGPIIAVEQLPESMARMPDEDAPDVFGVIMAGRDTSRGRRPESVHFSSLRSRTVIRDMMPGEAAARGFMRRGRATRSEPVVRAVNVPSHACTVEVTCAICLLDTKSGETVCTLPCSHTFHKRCLTPWLATKTTCPTCRLEL